MFLALTLLLLASWQLLLLTCWCMSLVFYLLAPASSISRGRLKEVVLGLLIDHLLMPHGMHHIAISIV